MKKVGDEEDEARQGSSWSDIRLAAEELSLFKAAAAAHKLQNIPTSSFLAASNLLLHVLGPQLPPLLPYSFPICQLMQQVHLLSADKIGPRLLVLRQDVERNTQVRSNPSNACTRSRFHTILCVDHDVFEHVESGSSVHGGSRGQLQSDGDCEEGGG